TGTLIVVAIVDRGKMMNQHSSESVWVRWMVLLCFGVIAMVIFALFVLVMEHNQELTPTVVSRFVKVLRIQPRTKNPGIMVMCDTETRREYLIVTVSGNPEHHIGITPLLGPLKEGECPWGHPRTKGKIGQQSR
ncbi:hypothetical protein LCGC14_2070760, partial [marine sediment metagenome]